MTQDKKIQVVMLATDKSSPLCLNLDNKLEYDEIMRSYGGVDHLHLYFLSDDEIKEGDYIYTTRTESIFRVGKFRSKAGFEAHSIKELISDTKEGETYTYCGEMYVQYCKKITATTNPELNLPKPSEEWIKYYIEEYNKDNIIELVNVEYEEVKEREYYSNNVFKGSFILKELLKVNSDNTINIKPIQETWDEVINNFTYTPKDFDEESHYIAYLKNWLKENYNVPTKIK